MLPDISKYIILAILALLVCATAYFFISEKKEHPLFSAEINFFEKVREMTAGKNMTLEENLKFFEWLGRQNAGDFADVPYQDLKINNRTNEPIHVRFFNPDLNDKAPFLIMFPGCGHVLDNFHINSVACSRIAAHAGAKIMLVKTRLAPAVPMADILNDCFDVVKHISDHAATYMISQDNIQLGGMSSGGHAAVVTALMNLEKKAFTIQRLVLLNGIYNYHSYDQGYEAYQKYEDQDILCDRLFTKNILSYLKIPDGEEAQQLYSPLHSQKLGQLPETHVIVAQYDGLRYDSEQLYKLINVQGGYAKKHQIDGQTHNTYLIRKALYEGVDPAETFAQVIRNSG